MKRLLALAYGTAVYSLSLATLSYTIMFIGNIVVPKTIDSGPRMPLLLAVAVNSLLFGVFAIQHSVMARKGFKRVWTQFVPQPVERTTFVLAASLVLMLLLWQWRAIPQPVWEVHGGAAAVLDFAFWFGWGLVLTSTFLINHFELFGLSQVWSYFRAKQRQPIAFRKPAFYWLVRHPLYLGLVIAFWSAPRMSVGHLLFSILGTGYILVGIFFEERDLVAAHGDAYRDYREEVPMLIPLLKGLKNMKQIRITLWLAVFSAIATLVLAANATAQTVVVGTGNPDVDVPAVQAAVDQGGDVVLKGHFSFDRPPTVPTPFNGPAMVLVSKAVAISSVRGERSDDREMTSIEGGTIAFYVEAPGMPVTIQGLRFLRPRVDAIFVYAVSGLTVASCRIEGAVDGGGAGIEINTSGNPPSPANPGKPENVSGTLLIVNNDIDVARGTASDNTLGVIIFSVGVAGAEVEVYVSGNTIQNTTERSINLYQVGGRTYIERNVITTSTVVGTAHVLGCAGTDVIHVTGTGSYLVAGNSIHSRWAAAAGIRVQGQSWPIVHAVVVDNDVNMEAPEGTVFDECSAGIDIFGLAQDNAVLGNRIRGRAGVALAVHRPAGGSTNNAFVLNRLNDFKASLADIFVADGVMNTHIVGQGTVEDDGVGTVIVRVGGGN